MCQTCSTQVPPHGDIATKPMRRFGRLARRIAPRGVLGLHAKQTSRSCRRLHRTFGARSRHHPILAVEPGPSSASEHHFRGTVVLNQSVPQTKLTCDPIPGVGRHKCCTGALPSRIQSATASLPHTGPRETEAGRCTLLRLVVSVMRCWISSRKGTFPCTSVLWNRLKPSTTTSKRHLSCSHSKLFFHNRLGCLAPLNLFPKVAVAVPKNFFLLTRQWSTQESSNAATLRSPEAHRGDVREW